MINRNKIKLIPISFLFLLIFTQCKKEEINEPGYAIGVINWYKPFYLFPTMNSAEISYDFFVNGKEYSNEYGSKDGGKKWKIPAHGNYNKGDQYMVQYDINDPGKKYGSRMLFNYKVNDSLDYEAYVKMFQTYPPQ